MKGLLPAYLDVRDSNMSSGKFLLKNDASLVDCFHKLMGRRRSKTDLISQRLLIASTTPEALPQSLEETKSLSGNKLHASN